MTARASTEITVSTDKRGSGPSVVVGVDGGPAAPAVLTSAGDEARRRRIPLELVTVVGPSTSVDETGPWASGVPSKAAVRRQLPLDPWVLARRRLSDAAARVAAGWPDVTVHGRCVPQDDIEDASRAEALLPRDPALLVVGAQGRRRTAPFGLGSASRLLVQRLGAPVLVVPRGRPAPSGTAPVLVGLRDSRDIEVLRAAAAESARRSAPLVVVLVGEASVVPTLTGVLGEVLIPPTTRVIGATGGHAASALVRIAEAEDAQLLVIGTRGSVALAGLAPYSTSRGTLRLSSRPVLLVPAGAPRSGPLVPA
jgi:nucleotide-binding universal stress UspA family protein